MRTALITLAITSGALVACAPATSPKDSGEALYKEFCVACHGATGRGDGPAAAGLARKPADLTGISERNGGVFPLAEVLSTVDGYTRAEKGQLTMPEFGVMLEDQPTVMIDTGDGILTPTPEPLLALAEYLRTLQK